MKPWKWFLWVSVLILLCVQNVSAKTMSNADLNGRYIVGSVTMDNYYGFSTDLLQIDANGSGIYDYLFLYSSSDSGGASGSSNYTINSDGGMTLIIEPIYKMVGGLSPNGQYFSVTWHETGAEPSILFGIKESTGMSVANLNGTYDMYSVLYEDSQLEIGIISLVLNGSGNWHLSDDINENGTYTVDNKGHVTIDTIEQHKGMVSNDGNVFFVVSTNEPDLEILIGIRRSSEKTISDFIGDYHYTEWGFDDSLVNNYLKSITIGNNNSFAYQDLFNTSNLPLKSGEVFISTNTNGSFSFSNVFTGTLSADGNVFAMNGINGNYQYLGVGIAKSDDINLAPKPNIIPIISSLLLDDDPIVESCVDISGDWVIGNTNNWSNLDLDQLNFVKESGCDFVGYWAEGDDAPLFATISDTNIIFSIENPAGYTINGTGTIVGDTMEGAYTIIGGPDDGEVGEWKAKKGELTETFQSLKVYAKSGVGYEIWGGTIDYTSEPNYWNIYYSIDQAEGYTLIDSATNGGDLEVFDNYPYYVIAVPTLVEIDAVLMTHNIYINAVLVGDSQTFLEKGNHDWGNVDSYLSPNWELMGLNILGAPDSSYSYVGSSSSGSTTGGTYGGYIILFNN